MNTNIFLKYNFYRINKLQNSPKRFSYKYTLTLLIGFSELIPLRIALRVKNILKELYDIISKTNYKQNSTA